MSNLFGNIPSVRRKQTKLETNNSIDSDNINALPLIPTETAVVVKPVSKPSSPTRTSLPVSVNFNNAVAQKNFKDIIENKGYKNLEKYLSSSDSEGFTVYYCKVIDPRGTPVYIDLRDIYGSIEIKAADISAEMVKTNENILSDSEIKYVSSFTGDYLAECPGDKYCIFKNIDEKTIYVEGFQIPDKSKFEKLRKELDNTQVKSENTIETTVPVVYPIITVSAIKVDAASIIEACSKNYMGNINKIYVQSVEKLNKTLESSQNFNNAVNYIAKNRELAFKNISKSKNDYISRLNSSEVRNDDNKKKTLSCVIYKHNEAYEKLISKTNEFNKLKVAIDELYKKIIDFNNGIVDINNDLDASKLRDVNGKLIDC
jgi:hypothetical protein